MSICEINNPVSCDNIILATIVGYKEKIYKTFCMEKDDLAKAIIAYYESKNNNPEENVEINGVYRKLLKKIIEFLGGI